MAILFLVRHAQVDDGSDAGGRLLGWTDAPLSPRGQADSETLRQIRWGPEPVAVYTSPLQRALRTAAPIVHARGLPLRPLADLREISCGTLDGQAVADVQRRHGELWRCNLRQDDMDFRWPGGESYREFRSRVTTTLSSIARRHAHEAVVVVTHAGVISQWIGMLAGINPARWDFHRPGYASITIVWCHPTREWSQVLSFDDRSHLGGQAGRRLAFATRHQPA